MGTHLTDIRAVDGMDVLVLVDNAMDLLSTVPDGVTGEVPNHLRAGATELTGSCLCCAAWGLSLAITVHADGGSRTLLFDSGPEPYALERNGQRLGFDFGCVECAVASHGHFDHVGGLPRALELITAANGGRVVPVHVNPGMFHKRAFQRPDGSVLPLGDVPSPGELGASGGEVVSSDEARLVLDDTVYISGEIERVTAYEQGLPAQVRSTEDGSWVPDPLVLDERYLAVHVRDLGVIVFSSCSHAGIVNVLTDARGRCGPLPLHGAMGGLHLAGEKQEQWIQPTVRDLEEFRLERLVCGHCTGWRALHALVDALGSAVVPGFVGQTHHFGRAP